MNFLQLLSSYRSDFLDDESDDDGSNSGSAGKCAFHFCFEEYVCRVYDSIGRVRGMGSGVFILTGIE